MSFSQINFLGTLLSVNGSTAIFATDSREYVANGYEPILKKLTVGNLYQVSGFPKFTEDKKMEIDLSDAQEASDGTVTIVGYVGTVKELRIVLEDSRVIDFSVCVNDRDKKAHWFNCVAWDARADFVNRWLSKGSLVGVVGKFKFEKYVDKDGNDAESIKLVAQNIYFVGGKAHSKCEDNSKAVPIPF